MPFNKRGYLSESATLDPNSFWTPNLLGGSIEYDVDISSRNCGCIAALYLVRMPGKDSTGNLWNTDGYYYCDANQVDGNYCPEFDIMEANQWAWATTPHACNAPSSEGFYDWCDRAGTCHIDNIVNMAYNDYGPGDDFKINTLQEFHTKMDFNEEDGHFTEFVVTMSQGDNQVTMNGACDYNMKMSDDMAGNMVWAVSNWNTYDDWLWGDRCQATDCSN